MGRVGRHDERDRHLVADRVGLADDRRFEHAGMRRQHLLDLDGRHVLAGDLQARRRAGRRTQNRPVASRRARSPVRNQPSRNDASVVPGSSR